MVEESDDMAQKKGLEAALRLLWNCYPKEARRCLALDEFECSSEEAARKAAWETVQDLVIKKSENDLEQSKLLYERVASLEEDRDRLVTFEARMQKKMGAMESQVAVLNIEQSQENVAFATRVRGVLSEALAEESGDY
jgi:tRNA(Ser,Leu) C12 N-acetylase TAN1